MMNLPRFSTSLRALLAPLAAVALSTAATFASEPPWIYTLAGEVYVNEPLSEFSYQATLAIIDRQSGQVRAYNRYDYGGGNDDFIEEPFFSFSGRVAVPFGGLAYLPGSFEGQLAVAGLRRNQVTRYGLSGFSQGTFPGLTGVGPSAVAVLPAPSVLNQSAPVVLVQSALNGGSTPVRHQLLLSPDTDEFSDKLYQESREVAGLPDFIEANNFAPIVAQPYGAGNAVAVLLSGGEKPEMTLLTASGETVLAGDAQPLPAGARVVAGDFFQEKLFRQLLSYQVGSPTVAVWPLQLDAGRWWLGEAIAIELPVAVRFAARADFQGAEVLLVVPMDGGPVLLLSLKEGRGEIAAQVSVEAEVGHPLGAFLLENGRLLVLGDGAAVGSGVVGDTTGAYQLFGYDDDKGQFFSAHVGTLPSENPFAPTGPEYPTVFIFDRDPLTENAPVFLGWIGSDVAWASEPNILGLGGNFPNVQYRAWGVDPATGGLVRSFIRSEVPNVRVGGALAAQVSPQISVSALTLEGNEGEAMTVSWNPRPGRYRNLVPVNASFSPNDTLWYRFTDEETWRKWDGPQWPTRPEFRVQYFLESSSGRRGAIGAVSFQFSRASFNDDANGDLLPNYVRIGLGLDPEGARDTDGDGASDFDEVIAGTDWRDAGDRPSGSGASALIDRGGQRLLVVTVADEEGTSWAAGQRITAYSSLGELLGEAISRASGAGPAITELGPLALGRGLPLMALGTDRQFATEADALGTRSGQEILGLRSFTRGVGFQGPPFSGEDIVAAAQAWVQAARGQLVVGIADPLEVDLTPLDTGNALAIEFTWELWLQSVGYLDADNGPPLTLFPFRPEDVARSSWADAIGPRSRFTALGTDRDLGRNAGEPLILADASTAAMLQQVATWRAWPEVVWRVYQAHRTLTPLPGLNPVATLRALLRGEPVPEVLEPLLAGDFSSQLAEGLNEVKGLAGALTVPMAVTVDLVVSTDSFGDGSCTVLRRLVGGQSLALIEADGRPYRPAEGLLLPPDTTIRATGYLVDRPGGNCVAAAMIVSRFTVLSLPTVAAVDRDGNLLDDDWEAFWGLPAGISGFSSPDGSGYSALHQQLAGTHPLNAGDLPPGPPVVLAPPLIFIEPQGGGMLRLSWEWPGSFDAAIRFVLLQTDDLNQFGPETATALGFGYLRSGDDYSAVRPMPIDEAIYFYRLLLRLR